MLEGLKIALCGEMRSGKDTVGKYLIDKYEFKRFAFGDGIVETCKLLFPHEFSNGQKPRKLLQKFGQFCVEEIDKYVWVNSLVRRMKEQEIDLSKNNIVITDMRQPHEYEELLKMGFVIVRVNTKPYIRKQRIIESGDKFSEEDFFHITESYIRKFEVDYEIDNNGTEEQLFKQVDVLIHDITGGGV